MSKLSDEAAESSTSIETKTKVGGFLQSPRLQRLLYAGTGLCTTLAVMAIAGPKIPRSYGE